MDHKPLTTGEIAKYCHVTYRCVLVWIEEGKLKAYKTPGGHNRVAPENFTGFLKKYNMPIPDEFKGIVKKKILIVDDDVGMINSIKRILRMERKYIIDTAINGFEAGRKLYEFRPDLVILDIRMPGMDGYEVAKKIKSSLLSFLGTDIKVIAASAYFEEDGKKRILDLGVEACLDKPFTNEELLTTLGELLN